MKTAISITLEDYNLFFLDQLASHNTRPKSEIINSIINQYRKFNLKKNISAGFKAQIKEDMIDTMSDFDDYLKLVDKSDL